MGGTSIINAEPSHSNCRWIAQPFCNGDNIAGQSQNFVKKTHVKSWQLDIKCKIHLYCTKQCLTQKLGYGRNCDPGRYSHVILLKMHERLQARWFPFMVRWFICSFRPIFSMGSCLHKCVLLGIRAYWNHPPKKRRRFFTIFWHCFLCGTICPVLQASSAARSFWRKTTKHSCVASSMRAMTKQTQLRSIQHACNDKTNTVA